MTIDNVTVSGSIVAFNDAAGIAGNLQPSKKTIIKNCTNNANITVTATERLAETGGVGRCSGIVSQYDMESLENSLYVINNTNNGNISGYKEVTGIIKVKAHNNITLTGNTNNGKLSYYSLSNAIARCQAYGPYNVSISNNINNNKDKNLDPIGYVGLKIFDDDEDVTLTSAPKSNIFNYGQLTINTTEEITVKIYNRNNLTIKNGIFKDFIWFGDEVDALDTMYKGTGEITGGTFNGSIRINNNDAGISKLIINGGTFNGELTNNGELEIYEGVFENTNTINNYNYIYVEGGTFNGSIRINNNDAGISKLKISGGTFNGKLTNKGDLDINNGVFKNTINNYINMYIDGGSINGNIINNGILNISKGDFENSISNYNEMTIEGGTFTSNISYGYSSSSKSYKGIGTINGGLFKGEDRKITIYNNDAGCSELSIYGGSFEGTITDYGILNIYKGEFKNTISNYNKMTIIDGTFTCNINYGNPNSGTNKKYKGIGTIEGGSFKGKITIYSNDAGCSELTINGGTFENSNEKAIYVLGTCRINGGDFSAIACTTNTKTIYVNATGNLSIIKCDSMPTSSVMILYVVDGCTYNETTPAKGFKTFAVKE